MYLRFEIQGDVQISRNLTTLDSNLKNWSKEFKETGQYLQNFFSNEVFSSRGSVFGEPWKPLSARYAAWKAQHYPGRGILERTGEMRKSFVSDYGALYTRVTNKKRYFIYHQSNQARARLPRRIMMKLAERQKQTVIQIFRQGLQGQINRSGFKSLYR